MLFTLNHIFNSSSGTGFDIQFIKSIKKNSLIS